VGRSLADPAVRDDFLVRRHAFRFVQRQQLLRRLEGPVLVDTVNWISSFYFLMMAEYPIEDREASYR